MGCESSEQMVRWRTVESQRNHLDEWNFLTTVVINICHVLLVENKLATKSKSSERANDGL